MAALGLADRLVGVSHECDHVIAAGLPILTASSLRPSMSASQIDVAVSASVADGGSLYQTDRAELHRLAPDVILSQDVCDVCAVNGEVAAADVPDGSNLVMLTAVGLADLWDDLRRVGRATGADEAADAAIADAQAALEEVATRTATTSRRRVVALDWGDPPFAAGHWVPDLVTTAGGVDLLATADPMSRRVGLDAIGEADPELVLFLPCGYTLDQAEREVRNLPLVDLCAQMGAELWAFDATRLFSRCTPQAVTSGAAALACVLHPEVFGPPADADALRVC